MEIDAIYSSPLKRAFDTARAIASHHRLAVQVEPDLREIEVGELEGVSIAELSTSFSQFILQWRQGQGLEKLPGSESVIDFGDRVWSAIEPIIAKHKQETVMVVAHYFVIVVAICKALGWPLVQIERLRIQTGSISIIDLSDKHSHLLLLGDTCYSRES
jgi:broad specificity phosphatase PhoE